MEQQKTYIYIASMSPEAQKEWKLTVELKNYLKNNHRKLPKFIKRHKPRDARSSMALKGNKPK